MMLKYKNAGNAYTSQGYLSQALLPRLLFPVYFWGQGHVDVLLPDTGKLNIADSLLNWCSMLPHGSHEETKMYWSTSFTAMKTLGDHR